MDKSGFVPILHLSMRDYRIPVWVDKKDMSYTVCVGDNAYRYYNDDTVPKELKALVAMVDAFPVRGLRDEDDTLNKFYAYVSPNEAQANIGWRITDSLYIVVISFDLLESMYMKGQGHG